MKNSEKFVFEIPQRTFNLGMLILLFRKFCSYPCYILIAVNRLNSLSHANIKWKSTPTKTITYRISWYNCSWINIISIITWKKGTCKQGNFLHCFQVASNYIFCFKFRNPQYIIWSENIDSFISCPLYLLLHILFAKDCLNERN